MEKKHIFLGFTLCLTLLCFYLLYRILSSFLEPILWAIFLGLVLFPLYTKLQHLFRSKGVLPAITMTILAVCVIVVPFALLILSLANEAADVYHSVQEMIQTGQLQAYLEKPREFPILKQILAGFGQTFDLSRLDPMSMVLKNLQQISTVLLSQSSKILKGLSSFFIAFLFTVLSLYYFFKDGDRLLEGLKEIVPLRPEERDLLLSRFGQMVRATIYGGLFIAIIQGLLGGLSFWILGLSPPTLWGTAMAFFSFIPVGGTALIWVPAAAFLFLKGAITKGIILLLIGILVISSADNFLRPFLVGTRTHIHPLLLFFTVIGGIQVFGMIGIIAGPLIATLCLTLIELYVREGKPKP